MNAHTDARPRLTRLGLSRRSVGAALAAVCPLLLALSTTAYAAAGDLTAVIDSIRLWVAGLLAALATLFLTIGGLRYLIANGNTRDGGR